MSACESGVDEMGTSQAAELEGVEHKPGGGSDADQDHVGTEANLEILDGMAGLLMDQKPQVQAEVEARSEVNPEELRIPIPVEAVGETCAIHQEMQAGLEATSEANPNPADTSRETVVGGAIQPEVQTELEARQEVDPKPVEASQEAAGASDDKPEKQTTEEPVIAYRCKKCRTVLATQECVVTHKKGLGERSFGTRKRFQVDDDDKEPECTCIFVEPMKWMEAVGEGYLSEKIFCIKCKARVGQFSWVGMQCSCGAWVNPAFQLVRSRIDECLET